jgi:hypothetical protein
MCVNIIDIDINNIGICVYITNINIFNIAIDAWRTIVGVYAKSVKIILCGGEERLLGLCEDKPIAQQVAKQLFMGNGAQQDQHRCIAHTDLLDTV